MDNKERIEALKAEIARLEKEDEFRPYLAWVSDEKEKPDNTDMFALVDGYDAEASYPHCTLKGHTRWKYATPLTREEILSFLPPQKARYDWDAILKVYPNAKVVAMHPNGEIVVGSYSKIAVDCNVFNGISRDGAFLFAGSEPEWILEKPTYWKDSIVYKEDVR